MICPLYNNNSLPVCNLQPPYSTLPDNTLTAPLTVFISIVALSSIALVSKLFCMNTRRPHTEQVLPSSDNTRRDDLLTRGNYLLPEDGVVEEEIAAPHNEVAAAATEPSQKTVWTHITDFCRAHSKAIAIAFTVIGAALAVFGLTWLTLGLAPLAFSGAALITPLIAGSISTAVGGGLIGGMVPLLKPAQI